LKILRGQDQEKNRWNRCGTKQSCKLDSHGAMKIQSIGVEMDLFWNQVDKTSITGIWIWNQVAPQFRRYLGNENSIYRSGNGSFLESSKS
jgi:hypothetical protein